ERRGRGGDGAAEGDAGHDQRRERGAAAAAGGRPGPGGGGCLHGCCTSLCAIPLLGIADGWGRGGCRADRPPGIRGCHSNSAFTSSFAFFRESASPVPFRKASTVAVMVSLIS